MSAVVAMGLGALIEQVGRIAGDLVTTEKERRELDIREREVDQRVALGQVEINKVEAANASLFVAGWRPAAGWACVMGLVYEFLFKPILPWAATLAGLAMPPLPPIDSTALMTLLFGMLGLGTLRTVENMRGRATQSIKATGAPSVTGP